MHAEGVTEHSPGSRSAPWVMRRQTPFATLKGLPTTRRQPLRGSRPLSVVAAPRVRRRTGEEWATFGNAFGVRESSRGCLWAAL